MKSITAKQLRDRHSKVRLLVMGEVGIDDYIFGDTERISPEAPVPVVRVTNVSTKLGLTANVVQNLVGLGVQTKLISVIGSDPDGADIERRLGELGLKSLVLLQDGTRTTPRKKRVLARGQHVVRLDYENTAPVTGTVATDFLRACEAQILQCDGIIIEDYAKGLWNEETERVIEIARAHKRPVYVDPNRSTPIERYRNCTLLTPNLSEAIELSGVKGLRSQELVASPKRMEDLGRILLEKTGAETVVITCGEHGMTAVQKNTKGLIWFPTFAREVYDVTGAGDTVIATIAAELSSGEDLESAMRTANAAAGYVVSQLGTVPITSELLAEELRLSPVQRKAA